MTPIEQAAMKVIDALVVEGPHPPTHRAAERRLAKEWPTLHRALMDLRTAAQR